MAYKHPHNKMKKIVLLMTFFLMGLANASSKDIVVSVVVDGVEMAAYEDSIVKVIFSMSWNTNFLSITIENKTDDRVYIEWENARFNNAKLVFDDDTRESMKNEKADEVVIAHSNTKKLVTSKKYVLDSSLKPITKKSIIKKNGYDSAQIILPMKYKDKNCDYLFNIKFSLE